MPNDTSSTLGTNVDEHAKQTRSSLVSTRYLCSSCQISFSDGQQQRLHMTKSWHVYNIKRRIASLPPISQDAFDAHVEKIVDIHEASFDSRISSKTRSGSDEETSDDEAELSPSPFQCLFCSEGFASNDDGLAINLEHMLTSHGMFIPEPERLAVDMQSLVGYLATTVRTWHECLYCGATKPSTRRIQSHMRDKGHCLLNLDREPELLEFWESSQGFEDGSAITTTALEQKGPTTLSATELRFPSGKIITSRYAAPAPTNASRKQHLPTSTTSALPPDSNSDPDPDPEHAAADASASSSSSHALIRPHPTSTRQNHHQHQSLTPHNSTSLAGLSPQQHQSLILATKTAQRHEAIARRAKAWSLSKGKNAQEFDQLDTKRKMGRQNHKLLPR